MLVKFDYAMKTLLRNKANFDVLEGFIEVFLGKKCTILNILESESNQESEEDKYNRVDIKAVDDKGEIFIVEVQTTRYTYYMERILFGVSKAVVEQINNGEDYGKIKKVYSISIIYYDFGIGEDFIYEGKTSFVGLNKNDKLKISRKEDLTLEEIEKGDSRQYKYTNMEPGDIMPVYYLIRVKQFRESARNAMNEWMNFLKNNSISPDTTVPGLEKAKEKLDVERMSPEEKLKYQRHQESLHNEFDAIRWATASGKVEGRAEGREEGLAEGRAEGRVEGLAEGRAEAHQELLKNAFEIYKSGMMNLDQISQFLKIDLDELKSFVEGRK